MAALVIKPMEGNLWVKVEINEKEEVVCRKSGYVYRDPITRRLLWSNDSAGHPCMEKIIHGQDGWYRVIPSSM